MATLVDFQRDDEADRRQAQRRRRDQAERVQPAQVGRSRDPRAPISQNATATPRPRKTRNCHASRCGANCTNTPVKLQHKPPANTLRALARKRVCAAVAVACAIVSARSRSPSAERARPNGSRRARQRQTPTCQVFHPAPEGRARPSVNLRQLRSAHNAACGIGRRVRSTRPVASRKARLPARTCLSSSWWSRARRWSPPALPAGAGTWRSVTGSSACRRPRVRSRQFSRQRGPEFAAQASAGSIAVVVAPVVQAATLNWRAPPETDQRSVFLVIAGAMTVRTHSVRPIAAVRAHHHAAGAHLSRDADRVRSTSPSAGRNGAAGCRRGCRRAAWPRRRSP